MFATNRRRCPLRPRHPSTQPGRRRSTGIRAPQRSIAQAQSTPINAAHPGCLGCFGCLRGGADWCFLSSDASPNSLLRQTCFDSVRTLQEFCLSSQSEASQLFITSRLRLLLPKPYRSQPFSLSPLPYEQNLCLYIRTYDTPAHRAINSSQQTKRNLISVITAITPSPD